MSRYNYAVTLISRYFVNVSQVNGSVSHVLLLYVHKVRTTLRCTRIGNRRTAYYYFF